MDTQRDCWTNRWIDGMPVDARERNGWMELQINRQRDIDEWINKQIYN